MSKGRKNKLAGQIGEFLVCAELGRRGYIATPFSGNVPKFDILAADQFCHTVPIQVKASRGQKWPTDIRNWLEVTYDTDSGSQINRGTVNLKTPDLVYVHVAISQERGKDRYFILTQAQLQQVVMTCYSAWMDPHEWKRLKNPESYDCRYEIKHLQNYEDVWTPITGKLRPFNVTEN